MFIELYSFNSFDKNTNCKQLGAIVMGTGILVRNKRVNYLLKKGAVNGG